MTSFHLQTTTPLLMCYRVIQACDISTNNNTKNVSKHVSSHETWESVNQIYNHNKENCKNYKICNKQHTWNSTDGKILTCKKCFVSLHENGRTICITNVLIILLQHALSFWQFQNSTAENFIAVISKQFNQVIWYFLI